MFKVVALTFSFVLTMEEIPLLCYAFVLKSLDVQHQKANNELVGG